MSDLSSAGSEPASPESSNNQAARNAQLNQDDESDEDVTTRKSRKHAAPVEQDDDSDVPMEEGDLFGDESGSEGRQSPKRRKLSDTELDSGDDEDRRDRMEEDEPEEEQVNSLKIIDYDLNRHGIPQGTDGEFYLLRFPQSMGIDPQTFAPGTFKKPIKSHHGVPPSTSFSAAQVANSTIRWRRDPTDPAKLQSNARIVRWSDGSLTIQLASMPFDQLELPAKALAPPQAKALKPTPISDPKKPSKYDARADSHTYLTSIHPDYNLVQVTNHITTSLSVQTTGGEDDEALIRLQEQLSAAAQGKGDGGRGPEIVTLTEDPELARKRAEAADRDRARADRRRQNQQEKERDRAARVIGGRMGRERAGLTIGGLEDDDVGGGGGGDTRRRPKPARKPRRRNSEYSEDEEEGYGRRGGKEDEYDKDDGFLVGSDEDIEAEDDDSEEDEFGAGDGDEDDDDAPAPAKSKPAESTGTTSRGARGRRVVDDDDDDE